MSSLQSAPPFENCSHCGQKTATEFLQTAGKRRICVLCADREKKANAAVKADIEDHRLNGGLGWLWKHIAYTAYVSVGAIVLRYLVKSYFQAH
jgi:hypothetical protein